MNPVEQEPQKITHIEIGGAITKGSRANYLNFRINALSGQSDSLPTCSWDRKLANDRQCEKT